MRDGFVRLSFLDVVQGNRAFLAFLSGVTGLSCLCALSLLVVCCCVSSSVGFSLDT